MFVSCQSLSIFFRKCKTGYIDFRLYLLHPSWITCCSVLLWGMRARGRVIWGPGVKSVPLPCLHLRGEVGVTATRACVGLVIYPGEQLMLFQGMRIEWADCTVLIVQGELMLLQLHLQSRFSPCGSQLPWRQSCRERCADNDRVALQSSFAPCSKPPRVPFPSSLHQNRSRDFRSRTHVVRGLQPLRASTVLDMWTVKKGAVIFTLQELEIWFVFTSVHIQYT